MRKSSELIIDGHSIFIEQLEQLEDNDTHDGRGVKDSVIEWTSQGIEKTIKPIMCILDSLKAAARDASPNEIELSMQFDIALKGETPVLKIVSAETSSQIAIKFTWKNEKV